MRQITISKKAVESAGGKMEFNAQVDKVYLTLPTIDINIPALDEILSKELDQEDVEYGLSALQNALDNIHMGRVMNEINKKSQPK